MGFSGDKELKRLKPRKDTRNITCIAMKVDFFS